MKIEKITAKKILDSAGGWTVQAQVELVGGVEAAASVPSGVSTSPFAAKNVSADRAVKIINEKIGRKLKGSNVSDQQGVDEALLQFEGANTRLAVSAAVCRSAALSSDTPLYKYIRNTFQLQASSFKLPKLMVLLFEGGKHGSGRLTSQEFMVLSKDVRQGKKFYETIKNHLKNTRRSLSVGLEGGFTPNCTDKKALEILNYILGGKPLALDVAFESRRKNNLNYQHFIGSLNLSLIEDPFGVEDLATWQEFNKSWGTEVTIVADDLTATNPKRIKKAVEDRMANAVVIKPNQVGTLTETLKAAEIAKEAGWKVVVSHRGQETNDTFIVDLAVGIGADYVKFGGFSRGERISKYNRLIDIQAKL